jgi:hypothetical protein
MATAGSVPSFARRQVSVASTALNR